ncbi:hypothetical protein [Embleya scabrispora]|uniref:hypothetical protein n=1 Tax=Embleya scabrispora TaxID=159449 RepID=UPI000361C767|nr:hypothetical protein [Embleya scabrispora]MYS80812.1 hypothetical protein [Streptomyces sp. SID5474]
MTQHDPSRKSGADELAALVWQARRWSESAPDAAPGPPLPDRSGRSFRARVRRLVANRPEPDPPRADS